MTVASHRWAMKKAARVALMVASEVGRRTGAQRRATPCVRVLTYHRFGPALRDPWCVSRDIFEAQMAWLADQELAVSLEDVLSYVRGERELRDGSVLVTMDDGFSSVWTEAMPIMRAIATTATPPTRPSRRLCRHAVSATQNTTASHSTPT